MIVKQGITMYEGEGGGIGRGQLSAAYSGLGQVRKTPRWPRSWANFSLL